MLHLVWSRERNDKTLTPTPTGIFLMTASDWEFYVMIGPECVNTSESFGRRACLSSSICQSVPCPVKTDLLRIWNSWAIHLPEIPGWENWPAGLQHSYVLLYFQVYLISSHESGTNFPSLRKSEGKIRIFKLWNDFSSLILRRSEVTRSHSLLWVRASDIGPSRRIRLRFLGTSSASILRDAEWIDVKHILFTFPNTKRIPKGQITQKQRFSYFGRERICAENFKFNLEYKPALMSWTRTGNTVFVSLVFA